MGKLKTVAVRVDDETYGLIRRNDVDVEEAIRVFLSRLGRRG